MLKNLLTLIIIIFICYGCNTSNTKVAKKNIDDPETIYLMAKKSFDNKNYQISKEKFLKLKKLYPLSNEAIQAEIMIGFIDYVVMDYESALLQFDKIINRYPSLKNMDYVYYMKAMCNYEQITHHELDGKYNELAIENFNQVINRFPDSQYAKDSRQKIILVKSNIAAKHMEIGRFYQRNNKYTAALNRFKIVIDKYSMTKFTPEALHRMVEIYYSIGMEDESLKIASTLGYNYPESEWYKNSYNLLNEKGKKKTILEKISNLF